MQRPLARFGLAARLPFFFFFFLAEASRVLRTGGIMVIAFTDKCLASKVLLGWKVLLGHAALRY